MLREHPVYQRVGEKPRRWFSSPALELIVWLDAGGAPSGFQLCYDRERAEKALTWTTEEGFSHMTVDDGEGRVMRHKASPILVPGGTFDAARVAALFDEECGELPARVAKLVAGKIAEFSRRPPAPPAP